MSGKLVALCGYKGSGKDTAAEVLVEKYGYVKVAFADPIREVCKLVFGISDYEMSDRVLKETPLDRWPYVSPRAVMQLVGTEMFRAYFPEVWIEAFKRRATKLLEAGINVVVTDLRFKNEEAEIQEMGGTIIRIDRVGVGLSDPHPSEAYISEIDADIVVLNCAASAAAFQEEFEEVFLDQNMALTVYVKENPTHAHA